MMNRILLLITIVVLIASIVGLLSQPETKPYEVLIKEDTDTRTPESTRLSKIEKLSTEDQLAVAEAAKQFDAKHKHIKKLFTTEHDRARRLGRLSIEYLETLQNYGLLSVDEENNLILMRGIIEVLEEE